MGKNPCFPDPDFGLPKLRVNRPVCGLVHPHTGQLGSPGTHILRGALWRGRRRVQSRGVFTVLEFYYRQEIRNNPES